jgi:hypothetical protein
MERKITVLIASIVICILMAYFTSTSIKTNVVSVDKSFDKNGNIRYWVSTEYSSTLRNVYYFPKLGDEIFIKVCNIYTALFILIAGVLFVYLVRLMVSE